MTIIEETNEKVFQALKTEGSVKDTFRLAKPSGVVSQREINRTLARLKRAKRVAWSRDTGWRALDDRPLHKQIKSLVELLHVDAEPKLYLVPTEAGMEAVVEYTNGSNNKIVTAGPTADVALNKLYKIVYDEVGQRLQNLLTGAKKYSALMDTLRAPS